jgi:integrase
MLSGFFRRQIRQGATTVNPVSDLLMDRDVRAKLRSTHDPEGIQFLESVDAVESVYEEMKRRDLRIATAFAVGALAGLRAGELKVLRVEDVHFDGNYIKVAKALAADGATVKPPKNRKTRNVPLQANLASKLKLYLEATGRTAGYLFADGQDRFPKQDTLGEHLHAALANLGLPKLEWKNATRHTFASLLTINGVDLFLISKMLGHASIQVTMRYAHLRPDLVGEHVLNALSVRDAPHGSIEAHPGGTVAFLGRSKN